MVSGCNPFPENPFSSITLTGTNGGGPVSPNSNGNINLSGTNIVITGNPATNSLTFTGPSANGVPWITNTALNVPMAVNTGYIDRFDGATQYQLPTTSKVGDVLYIVGTGLGYEVHQGNGQQIFIGTQSTTLGTAGYIRSQNTGSSVYLVCSIENQEWRAISVQGNIDII